LHIRRPGSPIHPAPRNPGFDVTPPELITGIITSVGILKPKDLWKNNHRMDTVANRD
jgi:methylthioribose-1-phosphate isomerase